jgi:hypothetical protein
VTLALKIEEMEAAQLRGEPVDAGDLTRLAGQLRRLLGHLKRKVEGNAPAPIHVLDYLAASQEDSD